MRFIYINYNDHSCGSLDAEDNGKAVERLETLLIKINPGNKHYKLTNHNGIYHRNDLIDCKGFEIAKTIGIK